MKVVLSVSSVILDWLPTPELVGRGTNVASFGGKASSNLRLRRLTSEGGGEGGWFFVEKCGEMEGGPCVEDSHALMR